MSVLKEFTKDKLKVKIMSDRDSMGADAASDAAELIRKLLSEKEEINIIFAAAPSQNETLAHLIDEKDIDWSRVNAFHMDEYIGLDKDAPQGFGNFLYEHIFSHLPFKNVYYLSSFGDDAEKAYSELLIKYPTDIVMMGIGENGHIAFNDPPVADFNDEKLVKVVALDPICRQQQVNDGCFASLDSVPTHALTLTVPALTRAQALFCTVPAPTKAQAVYDTVNNAECNEKCPATVMRLHDNATMYLEPDSAKLL